MRSRLRFVSLFVAVVAGDYAILMVIIGQLVDFGVAAAISAGSLVAAGLASCLGRRRRAAMRGPTDRSMAARPARGRPGQPCPSCASTHQKASESSRFADRRGGQVCEACAPALNPEPTR